MNTHVTLSHISVYGLTHALVDAAGIATLFAIVGRAQVPSHGLFLILFYNVLAFATQPLFGLLVDKFKAPVAAAVAGVLLVAAATLSLQVPLLAIGLTGLGNALFHVGGGVITLNLAAGQAALPGIYVAPGALGVTVGLLVGRGGHFVAWPFVLLLLGAAGLMLSLPRLAPAAPRQLSGDLRWFEAVILLLLVSVAIRGMVGMSLVLPWKSEPALLLILTGAVVLGKAVGGLLGDRFGWTRVAVVGLVLAAPLLTFFTDTPALAILGVFLFNLTMPVTLICVAEMLPGYSGFAFGLTALALIVGAWPAFTPLHVWASHAPVILVATLLSIAALYGGLRLYAAHFSQRPA